MSTFPKTTLSKITTSLMIVGVIVLGGFMLYVSTILVWAHPQDIRRHDAIIVLTGSKGRIETGFSLLLDNKAPRLLISGVQTNTTLDDLIKANSEHLDNRQTTLIKNHCCITLDHIADTTETNASEATKWINDNRIKSFILVTSSPHMPRAYLQFHSALADGITMTPYPYREESRFELVTKPGFWHYAAREYIKFVGSLLRLEQK